MNATRATPPGDPAERQGLNGDTEVLAVERAIAELRRGRVLAVDTGDHTLLCAAVETLSADALARLQVAGSPRWLVVTAERARSLHIDPADAETVALPLDRPVSLDTLRGLAGLGERPADASRHVPQACHPAAEEVVRLVRHVRLVPAVLVARGADGHDDPSLIRVAPAAMEHYRRTAAHRLAIVSRARVPLSAEENCELVLFRDPHADREHLAILVGRPDAGRPVPVRLHSACLTGDVLGSLRCDCGDQLRGAVRRIAESGGGVLLYLAQEGRGIGLANKLRAYALQDGGLDTFDADQQLGFGPDQRDFGEAAAMLHALGITRIKLLTNNPQKIDALRAAGIEVAGRQPLTGDRNPHNSRYLHAKRTRAGHLSDDPVDTATG